MRTCFSQAQQCVQEGTPPSDTGESRPCPQTKCRLSSGAINCAGCLGPAPGQPSPFSRPLPGPCLAFPFQLSALTLSFSWKVWRMEDNTPRPKESICLTSVSSGLDNMGAELLESLVCLLPHPHLGPWGGGGFVHPFSSLHSPLFT